MSMSLEVVHRKALAEVKRLPVAIRQESQNARLPFNYVAAQAAVAECAKVDECREWANKAEAVASYARQIKDFTMGENAKRIILRATRRMGELYEELHSEAHRLAEVYDKLYKKHKHNDEHPKVHAASEAAGAVFKKMDQARESMGNRHAQNVAKGMSQLPRHKFEARCDESPVLTPRQVLVAEGLIKSTQQKRSTPSTMFLRAIHLLKSVERMSDAESIAKFIRVEYPVAGPESISRVVEFLDRVEQLSNREKK